ncbi:MAG: hypothetical protein KJ006_08970 [Thermoleophilia bacterium]|nr:hypothetical protein [Thermoleophilia bacterium]
MSDRSTIEPIGDWIPHEQRWRACEGHMEREPGRLQLRVPLHGREGVCSVLFEEDETSVTVLILVCGEDDPKRGWVDCPVHIDLEQRLGDRRVVDLVRPDRPVPYRDVYWNLQRELGLPRP